MKLSTAVLLVFISIMLFSCMARFEPAYVSPDFTHANLWKGELVVGGVTSQLEEWDVATVLALSRSSYQALEKNRKDLKTFSVDRFFAEVGEDDFYAYNQLIRTGNGLDAPALKKLRASLDGVRYLLFSRVESDETSKDMESIKKVEDGKTEYYETYTISREVAVYAEVYDLDRQSLAWTGNIVRSVSESNKRERHENGHFWEDLLGDVLVGTYPNPPSNNEVFNNVFQSLANSFPKLCDNKKFKECFDLKAKLRKDGKEARLYQELGVN